MIESLNIDQLDSKESLTWRTSISASSCVTSNHSSLRWQNWSLPCPQKRYVLKKQLEGVSEPEMSNWIKYLQIKLIKILTSNTGESGIWVPLWCISFEWVNIIDRPKSKSFRERQMKSVSHGNCHDFNGN